MSLDDYGQEGFLKCYKTCSLWTTCTESPGVLIKRACLGFTWGLAE